MRVTTPIGTMGLLIVMVTLVAGCADQAGQSEAGNGAAATNGAANGHSDSETAETPELPVAETPAETDSAPAADPPTPTPADESPAEEPAADEPAAEEPAAPMPAEDDQASAAPRDSNVTVIEPGPDAQEEAQLALIEAEPGHIVEFAEGTFDFNGTLSCMVENVTVRGQGPDKTILSFKNQGAGTGGEGILSTADGFTVENLAVEDTKSDGIKTEGCTHVVYRDLRVEWTGGPNPDNGAYGVYPVLCTDVLIERCLVIGASDAGVYVGQSENVIVRNNEARGNVAGIEIENTVGADVYDNVATNNTGGLLVFSLPELPKKTGTGCRVFNNRIVENNHDNFAREGNIVATVPPGTGVLIMANKNVHVFDNEIRDNNTSNMSIISYHTTGRPYNDPAYDPFVEGVYIHDNIFAGGGADPKGPAGIMFNTILAGETVPDIIWDGIVNPEALVDDQLPPDLRIYIRDNGDADFANLDVKAFQEQREPDVQRDLAVHVGELPELDPIRIEGIE